VKESNYLHQNLYQNIINIKKEQRNY